MGRRGHDLLIVCLDDFLIIANSKEECAAALNCLIQQLGFLIIARRLPVLNGILMAKRCICVTLNYPLVLNSVLGYFMPDSGC